MIRDRAAVKALSMDEVLPAIRSAAWDRVYGLF